MDALNNGFKVLPVKFSASSNAIQYLYCKAHSVRQSNDDKPNNKTLFVVNVPPYCNEECFRRLFRDCGEVTRIFFQKKPSASVLPNDDSKYFPKFKQTVGYKLAYVVFANERQLEAALNMNLEEPFILSTEGNPIITGINKWCHLYNTNFPDVAAMQKEIDDFMSDYDKKLNEQLESEKAVEGMPDEEGWIKVTRHGRRSVVLRKEAIEKKIFNKDKKKRSQKELINFYTFQIRESKMENIAKLRKKFEDDKQRIALLKAARKFKPF